MDGSADSVGNFDKIVSSDGVDGGFVGSVHSFAGFVGLDGRFGGFVGVVETEDRAKSSWKTR